MKNLYCLVLLLTATLAFSQGDLRRVMEVPSAKPKHADPIAQSDRLAIRDAQLIVLRVGLQLQPLQIQMQLAQQHLQEVIDKAKNNSSRDPSEFTLDLDTWTMNPKPATH